MESLSIHNLGLWLASLVLVAPGGLSVVTTTIVATLIAVTIVAITIASIVAIAIATTLLILAFGAVAQPMIRAATSMAVAFLATTTIATIGVLLNQEKHLRGSQWRSDFTNISTITIRRTFSIVNRLGWRPVAFFVANLIQVFSEVADVSGHQFQACHMNGRS